MKVVDLLAPTRIAHGVQTGSKKRALELLSQLIVQGQPTLSQAAVFESLCARERLGGTGLGKGVALPHGRIKNTDPASDASKALGAFIQLKTGIDYDAIDKQPVDLLFALLVPEQSTDEHLQILATLAQMFRDKKLREQLRGADSDQALLDLLTDWLPQP